MDPVKHQMVINVAFFFPSPLRSLKFQTPIPLLLKKFSHKISLKKREREGYTQLNAEFHRIARRDKKDFLSEQCNEVEEKNRIGKTRDLFKEIKR